VIAAGKTNIFLAEAVLNSAERETNFKRVYEGECTGTF